MHSTTIYEAAVASTSNGETVGPIEGGERESDLILPSIALIREKEARDHITRQIPFPLLPLRRRRVPENALVPPFCSRVAKVENCTSIAPTSLFLIGEREMGGGVSEVGGWSKSDNQGREGGKWPHPSVCLADQFGGNREWVRRRRRRPLPPASSLASL